MTQEEKYALIEKYLQNELEEEEKDVFARMLEQDPSFREEVRLHRELAQTLKGEKLHQFREAVKATDSQWPYSAAGKTRVRKLAAPFRWAMAASVTILLAVVIWLAYPTASPSGTSLFAANFEPYPMVLNQRSESIEEALGHAIDLYNNGRFQEAARSFQELRSQDPGNPALSFYTGTAHLAAGDPGQAISILTKLVEGKPPLWVEQGRWYLALAYFRADQVEMGLKVLRAIGPGTFQYEKAKELLSKYH